MARETVVCGKLGPGGLARFRARGEQLERAQRRRDLADRPGPCRKIRGQSRFCSGVCVLILLVPVPRHVVEKRCQFEVKPRMPRGDQVMIDVPQRSGAARSRSDVAASADDRADRKTFGVNETELCLLTSIEDLAPPVRCMQSEPSPR